MNLRSLLNEHRTQLALVIGNGINRYGQAKDQNSWHQLLLKLAERHLPTPLKKVPRGVSLTEFYDLLDLTKEDESSDRLLQQEFCESISRWRPFEHHRWIMAWAKDNRVPVLTTNFEKVLGEACGAKLRRMKKGGFTAYYPWESYYGLEDLSGPTEGFGIWHINGMEKYRQSIRLGLGHYMGSVERARRWIHRGHEERLYSGKNVKGWRGSKSWLHILFNRALLIFGLGLEENEVFLRWLLLERAKYFRRFPQRRKQGWYVRHEPIHDKGKVFFCEGVGLRPAIVNGHQEIYGRRVWT